MTHEELARSIDGVYREILIRERRLVQLWSQVNPCFRYSMQRIEHHHGRARTTLELSNAAIKVIRERNKLRQIVFDLTYILNYSKTTTIEQNYMSEVTQPTAPRYAWLPKDQPANAALTKEELYDQVGSCNIRICALEQEIPTLEIQLQSPLVLDDVSMGISIRERLRDAHMELVALHLKVKSVRRRIIGRLELDLEKLERLIANAHPNWNEGDVARYDIERELELLRKLVAE